MPAIPYPDPPLRDDVVALRPFAASDVAAITAAVQDPDIPRWTVIPSPYTEEDARAFLSQYEPQHLAGHAMGLAIEPAGGGAVLGSVGLLNVSWEHRRAEVGYWVAADARRRSVATRALRLLSRWAFSDLGMERLEALVNPGNTASERVALRAGFTREGMLRSYRERKGTREDFTVFSLLPGELR